MVDLPQAEGGGDFSFYSELGGKAERDGLDGKRIERYLPQQNTAGPKKRNGPNRSGTSR